MYSSNDIFFLIDFAFPLCLLDNFETRAASDTRLSWRGDALKSAEVTSRRVKTFHLLNFIPRYFLSSFSANARPYLKKTKSPFRSPYRNMK